MADDSIDLKPVSIALLTIRVAEASLQARARAAGLDCRVQVHGFGSTDLTQPRSVGITLRRDGASFPQERGGRAVSWANAYSLAEFDAQVASGVAYLKKRGAG